MAFSNFLATLEDELTPEQRLHLNILVQAREDWATARALEYIDANGYVDPTAFRYKGKGFKLVGGFSIPMTPKDLHDLAKYWRSKVPLISINYLDIPDIEPQDFLKKLNESVKTRESKPSKMPLDTL